MAYVQVDVDLDDIDTDDLVDEVCTRLRFKNRKTLSDKEKDEIRELFSELHELFFGEQNGVEIKTLDDKMKMEHISSIFDKYTLSHIQSVLPL